MSYEEEDTCHMRRRTPGVNTRKKLLDVLPSNPEDPRLALLDDLLLRQVPEPLYCIILHYYHPQLLGPMLYYIMLYCPPASYYVMLLPPANPVSNAILYYVDGNNM
jgi:hypothetical protein